ncbi:CAP domain-containing protein [Flavihumibacter fluvii]|uniref:CAP domain-containing protein n=1 Tax=Flavihumibacter fluvii TaxID=2838157 RepID=UPI001BDE2331|nr:CAP domain-containing protein [Flavihumibacter fluvii]ULQ54335.1 CAP domain-containing protein [Flavihumibacter fluvii]
MLRHKIMLPVFVSLLILGCSTRPPATVVKTTKSKPAPVSLASMEASILQEVNKYRTAHGLSPLKDNSILDTEAALHSQQMASKQVPFGHQGYATRMSRIDQRLGGIKASAENVAYGNMTAREVVQSWLKSAPHKKNIAGPYTLSGIGVSLDKQGIIYFTQIFTQQ